jgi:hypothetical protein
MLGGDRNLSSRDGDESFRAAKTMKGEGTEGIPAGEKRWRVGLLCEVKLRCSFRSRRDGCE